MAGKEVGSIRFSGKYDKNFGLQIEPEMQFDQFEYFTAISHDVVLNGDLFPEESRFIVVSHSNSAMKLVPKKSPFFIGAGVAAKSAIAVVIGGPEIWKREERLVFEYEGMRLSLSEFGATNEFRKQSRIYGRDHIATGVFEVEKVDGSPFVASEASSSLSKLTNFLTFVRGGYCAFGNMIGFSGTKDIEFYSPGFTRIDPFKVQEGWCSGPVISGAPALYKNYCEYMDNSENVFPVRRSIEFYRAANLARESSLEVGLVTAYAGLETIVPHILEKRAGWSGSLVESRVNFADKLRAAASFSGISSPLLEHLPELDNRLKREQKLTDGFSLLAYFRNKITHAEQNFRMTGLELLEAFSAAQWLCEMFILSELNYAGDMMDRRKYGGWSEGPLPIPLKKYS